MPATTDVASKKYPLLHRNYNDADLENPLNGSSDSEPEKEDNPISSFEIEVDRIKNEEQGDKNSNVRIGRVSQFVSDHFAKLLFVAFVALDTSKTIGNERAGSD